MSRRACLVLASVALFGGCADGRASDPAAIRTVQVSGVVATSCVGPLILGRPPACSDLARFEGNGGAWSVRGTFSISLAPGTYRISVDTCRDQQTIIVSHAIAGLDLVPHCPLPL